MSLIPPQPAITTATQRLKTDRLGGQPTTTATSTTTTATTEASIAAQIGGSSSSGASNSSGAVTMEALRERAIRRGEAAQLEAERQRAQKVADEHIRLLQLLPAIADALRGMAVRQNRSSLLRRDCVESVAAALRLSPQQILQGFELVAAAVPEFLALTAAEKGIPATVVVNKYLVYKEVRAAVVEFARNKANAYDK